MRKILVFLSLLFLAFIAYQYGYYQGVKQYEERYEEVVKFIKIMELQKKTKLTEKIAMNERQVFRRMMAENGVEKTPDEIDVIIDKFCPSFQMYEKFQTINDAEICEMANECGKTYEYTKDFVHMALFIGYLKWEV